MHKYSLIIWCAVSLTMIGQAVGSVSNIKIIPEHPTSCDIVVITLSGRWGSSCVPNASTISVVGNDIYFDAIWDYPPNVMCLAVLTTWKLTKSVGPLSPGTYTVYARVVGYFPVPETYTPMKEFTVIPEVHIDTVYYVDAATGNNNNDGLSKETAFATIQHGVDTAKSGDTIIVAEGTYTGDGNRDIDFLGKTIIVRSSDPNDPCVVAGTVIDCQGTTTEPHRGFYFHNSEGSNSILDGFTITNGYTEFGGGIYCEYSSPTVVNCVFSRNSVAGGMGSSGGGICGQESDITVTNCTFVENYADCGGGIHCFGGRPAITGCTFRLNYASAEGGAVEVGGWSSLTLVTGCTFSGNSSGYRGGGLFSIRGNVKVNSCTFSGNSAEDNGGGLCNYASSSWSGSLVLTNCTFSNNKAGVSGGGVANTITGVSSLMLTNCILWDNRDADGIDESSQIFNNHDYNPTEVNYCCIQGLTGALGGKGNIGADPCFVNPDNNDLHLLPNSPCIDTGDPNYLAEPNETDLDGNPRVVDGDRDGSSVIDMGAYEFPNAFPVANAGPNQVVYAWLDGIAEVTLDGSGSYDEDGDELEYFWWWAIDGNDYEAEEVSPTIELPVGEHTIELIVNDGFEDSEPNQTTVTVIEPIKGFLWITPQMIFRQCSQRRIMATLRLPAGITKDQIDNTQKLTLYPGGVEAVNQCILPSYAYGAKSSVVFAYFDKDDVLDAIGGNRFVKVYAVGKLKTGRFYYGSNTIRIFNPRRWPRWGNMRQWFGNWNRHHPCIQNRR